MTPQYVNDKVSPKMQTIEAPSTSADISKEIQVPDMDFGQSTNFQTQRRPIYSSCTTRLRSVKANFPRDTITACQVGPYIWNAVWNFHSSPQKKLVVTIWKQSNYVFEWEFLLVLEFQDSKNNIIKKTFLVTDTHLPQQYVIDNSDPCLKNIRVKSPVTMQLLATKTNYIWADHATEINLEDPNRVHDFILVANKKVKDHKTLEVTSVQKTFYLHLSYLKAWSGVFKKMKTPTSPHFLTLNPETMSALLALMHPNMEKVINNENFVSVLKLAVKLEIPNVVLLLVEELYNLSKYPKLSIIYRLRIADSLKHQSLIRFCLEHLHRLPSDKLAELIRLEPELLEGLSRNVTSELLITITNTKGPLNCKLLITDGNYGVYHNIPEDQCDKTLLIEDEEVKINSVVLASWSKLLDELFSEEQYKNWDSIPLLNVNLKTFKTILQLIESQNINFLTTETVIPVIEVSDYLKMPSIIAMCGKFIRIFGYSGKSGIIEVLKLGERVNSGELIAYALNQLEIVTDKQNFANDHFLELMKLSKRTLKNVIVAIAYNPDVPNNMLKNIINTDIMGSEQRTYVNLF